jgi:hypothetical protein
VRRFGQELNLLVVRIGPHELLADGVVPQDPQQRCGQEERHPVDRDRDTLGLVLADVVGQQPGGEREKGDHKQQQQVQPDEPGVGALKIFGDRGVLQPYGPDGREAGHIGQIRGPQVGDRAEEIFARVGGNHDVEDEQGDGDGEHAVAEGLQPYRAEPPAKWPRRLPLVI